MDRASGWSRRITHPEASRLVLGTLTRWRNGSQIADEHTRAPNRVLDQQTSGVSTRLSRQKRNVRL